MNLAIHNEFVIIPNLGGIRLASPSDGRKSGRTALNVAAMLAFPCNAYILSAYGKILAINENSAADCGFDSTRQALGKSALDCLSKEAAQTVTASDRQVLKTHQVAIMNERVAISDEVSLNFVTIKAPVYDDMNKVAGIFGFSINLLAHSLADSLNAIKNLGILGGVYPQYKMDMSIFTPRQMDVINLIVRGRTSKEIAAILKISKRTVENYIQTIKLNLNVTTKSELITQLIG